MAGADRSQNVERTDILVAFFDRELAAMNGDVVNIYSGTGVNIGATSRIAVLGFSPSLGVC